MNTVLHRVLWKQHLKSEDLQGGSEVKGTSPTTLANPIPSLESTKRQKKSDSTTLSSNLDRHQYTHAHTHTGTCNKKNESYEFHRSVCVS